MNFKLQPNRLLNVGEKLTVALFNQIISGLTGVISGLVQYSELATSAVRAGNSVPGPYWFATGNYAAGVYSVSLNAAYTAYAAGDEIAFQASGANAAGAANVNVNAIGSKDLLKENGRELDMGDIPDGWIVTARYNGTAFQVLSVSAKPQLIRGGTATGTANALGLTLSPGTLTLADLVGLELEFTVAITNTASPVTLTITPLGSAALTAKNIVKRGAAALDVGDLPAGLICRAIYDGTNFQLLNPVGTSLDDVAVIASGRNVALETVTPTISRVAITADEVVLKNSSNESYLARNVATYADIATGTGAGTLDTGAEAANTHYAVFLIYNPSTGTLNGLFSLSATAPTMPAGYTFKAFLGWVRNDSGSDFIRFKQHDRECWVCPVEAYSGAGTNGVATALTINTIVPTTAVRVMGDIYTTSNNPLRALLTPGIGVGENYGQLNLSVPSTTAVGAAGVEYASAEFSMPLRTSQTLYWQTTSNNTYVVRIRGWKL